VPRCVPGGGGARPAPGGEVPGVKKSSTVALSTLSPYWSKISHSISHVEKYEQKRKNACYMKYQITDRPKCLQRDKTLFRNRTPFFIFFVWFLYLPQRVFAAADDCVLFACWRQSQMCRAAWTGCEMKGLQGFYILEDISLNKDNFSFCIRRQKYFLLCIHVELTAARGRPDTSFFSKFIFSWIWSDESFDCVFCSDAVALNK
jgi:hypothetical protein